MGQQTMLPNENLRRSNIRMLATMQQLAKENEELKKRVAQSAAASTPASSSVTGSTRMTPEELDSLYVEERRLIESLQKEVRLALFRRLGTEPALWSF